MSDTTRSAAGAPAVERAPGARAGTPAPSAHRTGSPIIPPGPKPAVLTAVLAVLVAVLAPVGQWAVLPALVVLQAVTAAGWFRLNGMWPARQGIALAFAGGLAADAAVLLVAPGRAVPALLGVLGVWFLLVLVLQLRHRGGADERLDALTATSVSTLLTISAAGLLAATAAHPGAVTAVAAGVAIAAPVRGVLTVRGVGPVVAVLAAAALGAALGANPGAGVISSLESPPAAGAAAAGAVCALLGLRVASYDWPSRFVHFTAGVALPLTAAAPVAYALARWFAA
ncbi:hypothetical protein [Streptomyces sp. ST2-7A]|uniref:hypothetical protein n=1 Tax=Streptomyces sp. ST2-7A TaxID=2907214 RepID=UPI001F36DE31|nr:hypothetical protein [Streptomyces sp. ST2-7A]MCE7080246.1 hypothetical protein [Streptomyces sp. ST2-7A]